MIGKPSLWIIAILFIADTLSKALVEFYLKPVGSISVLGEFFRLSYVQNTGAAFGQFQNQANGLVWVSCICLIILFFLIRKATDYLESWGYWLIFLGALGNLMDRIFRGYVVDFLDFDLWDLHIPAFFFFQGIDLKRWYVFNFADAYICVGTGLILWFALTQTRKSHSP